MKGTHAEGAYMTLTFDGWKSAGGRKLMGMLATVESKKDGTISHELRSTADITAVPETADLVRSLIEGEVDAAYDESANGLPQNEEPQAKHASLLEGLVSDSARTNVGFKDELCAHHTAVLGVGGSSFAHQLNLLTGFIITHTSLRSAAAHCNMVVTFFTHTTMWKGKLELCMDEALGKRMGQVKRADTCWFSHHSMAKRLQVLQPALEAWSTKFNTDRSLLATTNRWDFLELLRARRFWDHVGLLVSLRQPIVIDVSTVEQISTLATVC